MTATKKIEPARLGWVAGIIDLRGYLSDRPSSHADRRLPTVAVTMPTTGEDPATVISWLCRHSGVEPIRTGKGYNSRGCDIHCPEPHRHKTNVYDRWIIGGAKAIVFLKAIQPYLLVKRDEAQRLSAMSANYKAAHFAEMEKYGWPHVARL